MKKCSKCEMEEHAFKCYTGCRDGEQHQWGDEIPTIKESLQVGKDDGMPWMDEAVKLVKECEDQAYLVSDENHDQADHDLARVRLMDFIENKISESLRIAEEQSVIRFIDEELEEKFDGKLWSKAVQKAFEAPFVEVAMMHVLKRVAEKTERESLRMAADRVKELKVADGYYDNDWSIGHNDGIDKAAESIIKG